MRNESSATLSLPVTYSLTVFVSAALLFVVQPMVAKTLLPLLGGTPSVWNTCMVFFQALLLGGYAYAHFLTTRLSLRQQVLTHIVVLALAACVLPMTVPASALASLTGETNPVSWLLGCLLLMVGLPFFALSASGPLLQKWFAQSGHASASDPYFLYAASNVGSLLSLIAYPILLEPNLRLAHQSSSWMVLYIGLIGLFIVCGAPLWKRPLITQAAATEPKPAAKPLTAKRRLTWVLLAFVPSSLMLGVTTYLTTDIASVPLLWIIPLILYLLTFVFVFAKRQLIPATLLNRALPIATLALMFLMLIQATEPIWLLVLVHLLFFFIAGMVCHGRLAGDRPETEHLTEFYLWLSVGGVLGGLFNALLAPTLFNSVLEYPIVIALACWLRPVFTEYVQTARSRNLDPALAFCVGVLVFVLCLTVPALKLPSAQLENALIFGPPIFLAYAFAYQPRRFAMTIAAVLIGGLGGLTLHDQTLYVERNFFGVVRVRVGDQNTFHWLVHGNTRHGSQFIDPALRCEPLSYYHSKGPLGHLFPMLAAHHTNANVAIVGLGAGATAAYATNNQTWTFYEIDPAIVRVAQNTNYFTYLNGCAPVPTKMIVGDARLRLREAPDKGYHLIMLDAFSSDSIPMHLITREALALYVSKLAPRGLLAFHISNRYLDLQPVIADLAADAGLIALMREDGTPSSDDKHAGLDSARWVVMARHEANLYPLPQMRQWKRIHPRKEPEVWTDDFSNVLSVFRWQ